MNFTLDGTVLTVTSGSGIGGSKKDDQMSAEKYFQETSNCEDRLGETLPLI
jgi:hypothetical protein